VPTNSGGRGTNRSYTGAMRVSSAPNLPNASPDSLRLGPQAVLVPVKSFADAKRRLGSALDDGERQALVRKMAEQVLAAAAPLPVAVVCDDPHVAAWAREHHALVVWEPGRGLNGAVEEGVARLSEMSVQQVTVAHGDLPMAIGIGTLPPFEGITLVPDRHGDGTNVIRLPSDCGFRFSYGPGSFLRHREECARLGLPLRIANDPLLAFDVDSPADLELI